MNITAVFRGSVQQRFRQALNTSLLREVDFEVEFAADRVRVQFKLIESLFFLAETVPGLEGACTIELAPGEFAQREKKLTLELGDILTLFKQWVGRVAEELAAQPALREVEKNRARIEELEKRLSSVEDTYFTKAEAAAFSRRLDLIEAEFRRKAAEHAEQESLNEKLEGVAQAIQVAKSLVTGAKRSVVLRFLLRRLVAELDEQMPELVGHVAKQLTEGSAQT